MSEKPDYAVVLGIDIYAHLENLQGAREDAAKFRRWLIRCGVPEQNIYPQELENDESRPKIGDLTEPFEELCRRSTFFTNPNFGRRLYVFVSGHGAMKELYDAHLLAANFQASGWRSYLAARQFVDRIAMKPCFEEVVIFSDCCRTKMNLSDPFIPISNDADADCEDVAVCYAYATGPARKARERYFDDESKHTGLFTRALLEALEGGAATTKGLITPESVKKYLEWRMEELNASQKPRLYPPLREIVFGKDYPPLMADVLVKLRSDMNAVDVFDDSLALHRSYSPAVHGANEIRIDNLLPGNKYVIAPKGISPGSSEARSIKPGREQELVDFND